MACSALALFCDDVRHEIGNKLSIIGLYGADLTFVGAKPPLAYPKLCVVLWIWGPSSEVPDQMTVRIFAHPGRTQMFEAEIEKPKPSSESTDWRVQTIIEVSPLGIKRAGAIQVEVSLGEQTVRAGQLMIRFPDDKPSESSEPAQPA